MRAPGSAAASAPRAQDGRSRGLPALQQPRVSPAPVEVLEIEAADIAAPGPCVVGLVPTREPRAVVVQPEGARGAGSVGMLSAMPAEQAPIPAGGWPRPSDSDAGLHAGPRIERREKARPAEVTSVGRVPLLLADVGDGRLPPGGAARCCLAAAGASRRKPSRPCPARPQPRPPAPIAAPRSSAELPSPGGSPRPRRSPGHPSRDEGSRSPAARRGSRPEAGCGRGEIAVLCVLNPRVRLRLVESPAYSPPEVPEAVFPERPAGA